MLIGVIRKITDYLIRKGIGIFRIKVFAVQSAQKLNQINLSDYFSFRTVDHQVLNDIFIIRGKKKYHQMQKILYKGAYGVSLYRDNELAAYGWVGLNKKKYKKRVFTSFAIPQNCAHIFECYTVEKYRGQKLYPAIVFNLVEWAKNQQTENVYIETVVGNIMAEKGIAKLGFDYISLQIKLLIFSKLIFEYDRKK